MEEAANVGWMITDHVCLACGGGRILSSPSGIIQCANCGITAVGAPDALCACGTSTGRLRLRCVRRQPTAECPVAIAIVENSTASGAPAEMPAYSSVDGFDGRLFRCETYRATLTTAACAKRWKESQCAKGEDADRLARCRTCPIGALHAGERVVEHSALYQAPICPRCGRGTTRMIGGEVCVSCYNRAREFIIGRNAKGTRPTISLSPRHLGLIVNYGRPGQQYLEIYDSMTHSTIEVIFKTLRTARVPVAFCLPLRRSRAVAVAELANLLSPPLDVAAPRPDR